MKIMDLSKFKANIIYIKSNGRYEPKHAEYAVVGIGEEYLYVVCPFNNIYYIPLGQLDGYQQFIPSERELEEWRDSDGEFIKLDRFSHWFR